MAPRSGTLPSSSHWLLLLVFRHNLSKRLVEHLAGRVVVSSSGISDASLNCLMVLDQHHICLRRDRVCERYGGTGFLLRLK